MSGHSKWANIRVKKTAEDARRGKVFTRHARLIEIAARAGGPDPATNNALRTAIENARAEDVPNVNIERAVKKGTGALKGEEMREALFAAYGAANTAYLIECLTDNRNRTIANLKVAIGRHGGRWTEIGSVQWMFERRGVVTGRKAGGAAASDDLQLQLIDAGAEEIDIRGDVIDVTATAAGWAGVREVLKGAGYEILEAGLEQVPKQTVNIADLDTAKKIMAFMEALEEDDDVVEVFTNADIPEDIAEKLA